MVRAHFLGLDNNGNVSTLYNGAGQKFPPATPLVVNIPAPGATTGGTPTGNVFNAVGTDFMVTDTKANLTGSSLFIFATEDGTIVGWSPAVNRTQGFIAVDNSMVPNASDGAVYKGLAIATAGRDSGCMPPTSGRGLLTFSTAASIPVHLPGAFIDRKIKHGFAPFGIQAIGDRIYVTYAKQDAARHDDVKGPGNGFVDVFNTDGKLLQRLIRRGHLNSPWGLALAPQGFGEFGGDLLVGDFGDGRINAYSLRSGELEGSPSAAESQADCDRWPLGPWIWKRRHCRSDGHSLLLCRGSTARRTASSGR